MTPEQRSDAILNFLAKRAQATTPGGEPQWSVASDFAQAISASVDRTSIFRDLQRLVEVGLVEAHGPTRARVYRLDPTSRAALQWELSQPPEARHKVEYNPQILRNYQPNHTSWLSAAQKQALLDACHTGIDAVDPDAYRVVMNNLLIDLSYASSRLEDVQISWIDTKSLIEFNTRPEGLTDKEYRIVVNHKEAIQFICENRADLGLSRRDILDVHRLLSAGLLGNPADEGRVRQSIVYFTESAYRPISVPSVLDEEFRLYCEKASQIEDPFEAAMFSMAMIPYLQPFQDGNKRTSRLSMNIPLLSRSLAPFSFTQIDRRDYVFGLLAFYERGRTEFLADAFVAGYARSAPKYAELMAAISRGATVSSVDADAAEIRRPGRACREC